MPHLIITLPKSVSWSDYEREMATVKDGSMVMNFRVPGPPLRSAVGDRCYVVHNGAIRGHMTISGIVHRDGFTCDATGTVWPVGWYVQRTGPFTPLENPRPMKGFQGYRYVPQEWNL